MKIINVEDGSGAGNNEGIIIIILYHLFTRSILKFTDYFINHAEKKKFEIL